MEQRAFQTTKGMFTLEHSQICKPKKKKLCTCKTACCLTLLYILEEATEKVQFAGTAFKYVSLCKTITVKWNGVFIHYKRYVQLRAFINVYALVKKLCMCKTTCCLTFLYIVEETTEKIQFADTATKYVSQCKIIIV